MNYIITTSCNKGCPYCFAHESRVSDPNSFMSVEMFESLINKSDSPVKLLGGEPTQHPHFKEIIQILIDRNKSFTLISNFLFSQDIKQVLLDAQKKVKINYLINATDLDIKNRMDVWKENYNDIYATLYEKDREENMSIGITVFNEDVDYYIKYFNFLLENTIALERFRISINFPGDAKDKNKFGVIENKTLGSIVSTLVSLSVKSGIKPNIDCIIFPCMFNNKEEFKYIRKFSERCPTRCGDSVPSDVFPDNTMSFCYPLKEDIKIDLHKYDRIEQASSELVFQYKVLERNIHHPEPCLKCGFKISGICNGPCLGFHTIKKA